MVVHQTCCRPVGEHVFDLLLTGREFHRGILAGAGTHVFSVLTRFATIALVLSSACLNLDEYSEADWILPSSILISFFHNASATLYITYETTSLLPVKPQITGIPR